MVLTSYNLCKALVHEISWLTVEYNLIVQLFSSKYPLNSLIWDPINEMS